jgi:hypothetical protein
VCAKSKIHFYFHSSNIYGDTYIILLSYFIFVLYKRIMNPVSVINTSIQLLKLLWSFDGFLELEGKRVIIHAPPLVQLQLVPLPLVEEDFMDGK